MHDRTLQVSWEDFINECNTHLFVEVAFVGKAPGSYVMLLGGGYYGQRMNKIYRGVFAPLIIFAATEVSQKMSLRARFLLSYGP